MSRGSFFRSRWVRIPLYLIGAVILGVIGFLTFQLTTTHTGMYMPDGNADPAIATDPADAPERLVYTSLRPSNWDVFLFDDLDAEPRRLTDHPNLDYNPELSSDGRWVVFVSEREGNANLYAMDLEGDLSPVQLTSHPGMDDAPTISPDGTQLAFVSTRDGNPDIFLMPFAPGDATAEGQARNLTQHPHGDFNPAFSPNGSRLAFSSNRGIFRKWNPLRLVPIASAMTDIYVMDLQTEDVERAISAVAISGAPAWMPEGDGLLYYQASDANASGIYRTIFEGDATTRLSPADLVAMTPTSGPEGSTIFIGLDDTEPEPGQPNLDASGGHLYITNQNGEQTRKLVEDGREYLSPHYHHTTGRLVVHGDSPVPDSVRMANTTPFTWAGAEQTWSLSDRSLHTRTFRSYFPSFAAEQDRVMGIQWVHEYKGYPPGPSAIVSANMDGTGMETIAAPGESGFMWTPVITQDGEWIIYSDGPRFAAVDEDVDIWKVRTDDTEATNLTPDSDFNDAFPDVSADGEWIVFRSGRNAEPGSGRDGNKEIYLMRSDGSDLRRITNDKGNDTMPAISPDGKWVVYTTDTAGNGLKLWIRSLEDPDDEGRLVEPDRAHITGLDMHPRFSPDGKWIAFTSDRAGYMDEWMLSGLFPQPYGEIYAVPVDGSGPAIRLTHDKWEDALPFWGAATRN